MDLFTHKNSIRLAMLEKRGLLSSQKVVELSEVFGVQIERLPELFHANRIGIYAPYKNEAPTEGIFKRLLGRSGEIFFPRVVSSVPPLEFVKIDHMSQLVRGFLGIQEPGADFPGVSVNSLEAVLVPGVAFDEMGRRIGWGKGYYDQTLAGYSGTKIGLAYDFQVVESIPAAGHDQVMDLIITEKRVISCRSNVS